jgi:hypothetical protein
MAKMRQPQGQCLFGYVELLLKSTETAFAIVSFLEDEHGPRVAKDAQSPA